MQGGDDGTDTPAGEKCDPLNSPVKRFLQDAFRRTMQYMNTVCVHTLLLYCSVILLFYYFKWLNLNGKEKKKQVTATTEG